MTLHMPKTKQLLSRGVEEIIAKKNGYSQLKIRKESKHMNSYVIRLAGYGLYKNIGKVCLHNSIMCIQIL